MQLRAITSRTWQPFRTTVSQVRYESKVARNLFQDTEREEDGKYSRDLAKQFNDPVWYGDERLEDTVLRMLMDKYKPLRLNTAESNERSIHLKVPKPTSRSLFVQERPRKETRCVRPYTPPGQPWNAVFVNPTESTDIDMPIKRGRIKTTPPKSKMAEKMERLGITPCQLPLDDRNRMNQLRTSLQKSLFRERIENALDKKHAYTAKKATNEPEKSDMPIIGKLGGLKGLAAVAEQRIEEARKKGVFERNKLRGKPLFNDENMRNPHLQQSEVRCVSPDLITVSTKPNHLSPGRKTTLGGAKHGNDERRTDVATAYPAVMDT